MPLSLGPEETTHLLELASPIARSRQGEFLSAVTTKLETSSPTTIGIGTVHRAALAILGDGFWSPPADLRQGRLGPRGPRS